MKHGSKHHLLYEKAVWESRVDLKSLRNNRGLQVSLDRETHNELHRQIISVPVPDRYMAARVINSTGFGTLVLRNMDNLMFAFDEASRHPKANKLDYELGQLIIASIEAQKPFIHDGVLA